MVQRTTYANKYFFNLEEHSNNGGGGIGSSSSHQMNSSYVNITQLNVNKINLNQSEIQCIINVKEGTKTLLRKRANSVERISSYDNQANVVQHRVLQLLLLLLLLLLLILLCL